ncbi:MAG: type II toxin-antitoxin system PemK/MazF family toxin [Candidatus Brocadiaceae bacterium]|uniref:type II toxin-antitoxin system PemK/MazF family toxin n=1 Tax=Candidatus Wunengus sp. YC61 TaxID=3367698 RepID=UPI00271CCB00|nr:type II toxin-antitoxin system PemK/MazF family toxin [Candidatus Brocadiaceae bacterium]
MIAPKQGDIYLVTLDPTIGTEMAKTRPGVIVSNDHANKGSNRVSVVPITSSNIAKVYPFEVFLSAKSETGLNYDSKIACDQVRSVDKRRLLKKTRLGVSRYDGWNQSSITNTFCIVRGVDVG